MKITNYETNLQNNVVEYYIDIFNQAAHSDEFNDKLINSILQKLRMKKVVLNLEKITLYQLFCIKRIPDIAITGCKTRPGEFHMIETESQTLAASYTKLIQDTFKLTETLAHDNYNPKELFPLSTYTDIQLKCSMDVFLKFIQICLKYDELSDIVEGMLEFGMDGVVHLSNIVIGDNIFLIEEIDPILKGELSDDDKLVNTINVTNLDDVKHHEIIGCLNIETLIAISPYINPSDLLMENPYLVMTQYLDSPVDIVLSENVMESDKLNMVYDLVNKWLDLITECMEIEGDISKNMLHMQLLCFAYKFMLTIDDDTIAEMAKSSNPNVKCFLDQILQNDVSDECCDGYEGVELL